MKQKMTQHVGIILPYKEQCGTVYPARMRAARDVAPTLDRFELLNSMVEQEDVLNRVGKDKWCGTFRDMMEQAP